MKFKFVNRRLKNYQDMRRLLRIFAFLSLVLSGKTDIVEETTLAFNTVYQPTTLINESHEVKQNASETTRNIFSSVAYNSQTSLNSTSKKLVVTYLSRLSPSSTSETFYKHNFNYSTTANLETLNHNSFNENEIENNSMLGSTTPLTENSNNFSEQFTITTMLPETENQNEDITPNLEFQNENISTPATFIGNENNEITTHLETDSTSLVQNTSTQNPFRKEMGNTLNTPSEMPENSSYSHQFSSYDLDEINIRTTEISETNTEKDTFNREVTNNISKNVNNSENVSEIIVNITPLVPTSTDITNLYTMHLENNTFQNTEISPFNLSALATSNSKNASENFVEATSPTTMSKSSVSTMTASRYEYVNTNNISFNGSVENDSVNKQEASVSINQSSITNNYSESNISTIQTQQTTIAARNDKQKVNNSTLIRNNDNKEEITISSTPMLSVTPSSSRSLSDSSIQETSSEFPNNENVSLKISYLPSPTVTQDHQHKEFFFKHVNNLTDDQRKNMTVDIIFISTVDIVEWFHSYDQVFRTTVASLLTQANESESIPSINIIYIAPTPLKNEKYFCITFMVESALQKNTYEHGERVVQKIKQNISDLSKMLRLPVESILAGYIETGKCHKTYHLMQERNWVIIVVLGVILMVAIIVILTMCIQKSRNGKQSWEQDEQEWCATIHDETGRYRSGYQLPINVQNSSNNMVDHFSRVNQKVSLKEENNKFVSNNGVENVLIHNEEKNYPETTCGECNKMFVEDTKL